MGEAQGARSGRREVLGEALGRFIDRRPVTVMVRAIMQNALGADAVDTLFEKVAQDQYTRQLTFSTMVDLMSSVVCGGRPNIHAAYQERVAELPATVQAVYDKLAGVEPNVCAALVRHTGLRLGAVIEAMGGQLPPLLPGRRMKILDGNHQPASERRLKPLRGSQAGPLPGFCLVVLDPAIMQAIEVIPCEDGHAQERSLTDDILALVEPGDVWMDDRNFCTTRLLFGIPDRDAFFITRQHAGNLRWRPIGRRRKLGRIDTGMVYEQEVLLWEGARAGRRLHVRRITVVLDKPTRDGETEIHVLTNLPEAEVPGQEIARVYAERWTLERMFQELEANLCSELRTLGYPRAALFGFCIGVVAYNVLSAVKAALRAAHGHERIEREFSSYYMALELQANYEGLCIAVPETAWTQYEQMPPAKFGRVLIRWAGHVSLRSFRRHPRGPKKPVTPRTRYRNHTHVSTGRLLVESRGRITP